ncbi:hypothetical protein R1flu_003474 [Riccia fluitans]|uniref:Uncharacterized protein n=1 Tax=Riccia fluitans TaxID=41844 RepID=A0ABD1YCT2_9MARC
MFLQDSRGLESLGYKWQLFGGNDPNVQPLVKGLDADDFSVDKFFGLQDPTSQDDVQASPDFEEDLRTNEHLRLQVEVRNLGAELQWVTRSTRDRLDYEPTILPDVPPTDNPTCQVTLDLRVDAREDPSSPPPSQIVPVPTLVDLTQLRRPRRTRDRKIKDGLLHNMFYVYTFWFTKANELVVRYDKTNHAEEAMIKITRLRKSICPELHDEDISQGTHDPEAIFHVLKQVLWLIVPIDPALVMMGIMNVEQQQDGHLCGKHVLQSSLVPPGRSQTDWIDVLGRRGLLDV